MAQLQAYDRWDFLKNRPIPLREPFNLFSEPMPQFGHLLLWARLRLLHGLRTGQPLEPWARRAYREAYTALEEDLEAFPCSSSLGQVLWQSGVTLDNGAAELVGSMPQWMQRLPRALFGARLANWAIADGSPNLHRLHAFRKALATGDFESEPIP
jgi:hypothetical protein